MVWAWISGQKRGGVLGCRQAWVRGQLEQRGDS